MDCEFCKKILSSKSNLNYHKKNNKSCLTIQQKSNTDIKNGLVNCEFCNDSFSEQNLIRHLQKCKIKPIIDILKKEKDLEIERFKKESLLEIEKFKNESILEIEKLKKENNDLKFEIVSLKAENNIFSKGHQEMMKLAKQPKTTKNNNITIGHTFFNDTEKVKDIINSKLDRFDIAAGQKGIAQFAAKNILKNDDGLLNYVCTDQSRGVFNLLTETGECEKDIKAKKLTNLLFESGLKNKTHDLGKSLWTKEDGSHDGEKFLMYQEPIYEINTMSSDNSTFRNELACLTTS
jgi:hypothetical protein